MTTSDAANARPSLQSRLPLWLRLSDVQGLAQLAAQAMLGVTSLAETAQGNVYKAVAATLGPLGARFIDQTPGSSGINVRGITGIVYGSVKGITRLAGGAVDTVLSGLASQTSTGASSPPREAMLSALNGVLGDHLLDTANPLTVRMSLRHQGQALTLEPSRLAATFPTASAKVMVFVHGLCMNDLQWSPPNASGAGQSSSTTCDYAVHLAHALGYTPIYLHYNSGRHVSINGDELAQLLETLWHAWPQPITDLSVVAHSMGGLVSRAACHQADKAGHVWRGTLKNLVFLGTPHHGAPLETLGNWLDTLLASNPVTRPFARIGHIRSAGITDLRHGNVVEGDCRGGDRFERAPDARQPLPLPAGVSSFTVAGSTMTRPLDADSVKVRLANQLLGDGLVPVASALGLHQEEERSLSFPPEHQWTAWQTGHMALLHSPAVGARLRIWLSGEKPPAAR
ncbi:MAG: alpha/beta hydrolase [Polaromonas sp.]|nr:alpha/beta hydrolase [Polaromonas sp.]